ncbi:Transketolase [Methylobacterium cerastii]|uniref:Transketolase n=1 Tax=Methylobacterium cerastii TaxID=932741 RepID=A0ABQ4QE32_9HYPH|nr:MULTISPECIES: transketolase [Methylobacterium]TXM71870.1 transketolase [Methylobacterium sp. WL12]TXN82001.1 transketolase [Methylobacterium sp. WL8]GJD43485.1 Transketolase [Methylobacterium cerastii]
MSGADTVPKTALSEIDKLSIDTIRTLAIDAVQKANSGHAGAPMALAPVAYTLWNRYLRYDPAHPHWPNRDRFVLSCGHASMLLYALLHLAGVAEKDGGNAPAVTLEDIKKFRQLDSRTPGHPEYHFTTGVETTTGPLGQGVANSVGMAMGGRYLGEHLNRPELPLFDYNVYAICSDGDLMEGVASEAASIAGHLRLSNLCWIYDNNTITIEGHTELAFGEEVATRFLAYGWQVLRVADANDVHSISGAIETFLQSSDRPTIIIVNSIIGFGAPKKQNTSKAHSDALGEDEAKGAKRAYGWPEDAQFLVPDGVQQNFSDNIGKRGAELYDQWQGFLTAAKDADPEHAETLDAFFEGRLPEGWDRDIPVFEPDAKGLATRESSGKVLNAIAQHVPFMLGGSADLAPSNKSNLTFEGAGSLTPFEPGGRNIHFGVREHAMGSIVNGLGLSGLRAYGATFLVFVDYMRPAVRLASLMELPVFHIFTHDSIGVGEDGPTHQPVEQLLSLRCIPGLVTLRPADANEVAEAYRVIFSLKDQPAVLALSRQPLPTIDRTTFASASGVAKGGYVLAGGDATPEVILIGSGSEVQLCLQAYESLKAEGVAARVVSMPSWDLFERQDEAYRESVLPPAVLARVAVEQGSVIGWDRYAGSAGTIIGMHTFGSSAPIKDLQAKFGFTPEKVLLAARDQIAKHKNDHNAKH